MRGVSEEYISRAIDELIELLGIKEDIPLGNLHHQVNNGNIKRCIEDVARYLGLPIAIDLSYVPASNQPGNTANRFESSALSPTDKAGQGVAGITAQVDIPANLPFFGSPAFEGFPIHVKISDSCKDNPAAFVPIMAHELSHILLRSLNFREKDNEYYTDLTAMILGFSEAMKGARKLPTRMDTVHRGGESTTGTYTTTYGYLSDELFYVAFSKIQGILGEHGESRSRLLRTLNECSTKIQNYETELNRFNRFVEYLDKKHDRKIKTKDSARLVSFHQLGYSDDLGEKAALYGRRVEKALRYGHGFTHYTKVNIGSLQKQREDANMLLQDIEGDLDSLKKDVGILEKYVGFFYRYKINRQAKS